MSASAPRWRAHDRRIDTRRAQAAAGGGRGGRRAAVLRHRRRPQAVAGCVSGRDQRAGADRHRGARALARGGRALRHRTGGDGDDRPAGADRDALAEQARPVADHAGVQRRDRRVLRAPAGDGAHHRSAVAHAGGRDAGAGAGVHGAGRGLPVHARSSGRRQPGTVGRRVDPPPHRPGLGGAAAAALHSGRGGDQLAGRLREAIPGAGQSRAAAPPQRDGAAGVRGAGRQQRQLGRRRAAAFCRAVPDPRRGPGARHQRHRRHRAQGSGRHAADPARRGRGEDRHGGARGGGGQERRDRIGRRRGHDDARRQRQGSRRAHPGARQGHQRQRHAARRPEDRAVLRALRAGRCGARHGGQGAARGRGAGGAGAAAVPGRHPVFADRGRHAGADAAADLHGDEPAGHLGQPDVAGRAGDRHRPDGGRLGGGGRERVRASGQAARPEREPRARHPACRDGGGHAGDLRGRHHHPGVPAADDAAGHGGQDVRAAGVHHRDRAVHLAGAVADADAGAVVVPAQAQSVETCRGRSRRRRACAARCARHLADPQAQEAVPAPAGAEPEQRPQDRGGGRGGVLRHRRADALPGHGVHPRDEGGLDRAGHQPRAQHLAGRIGPHGDGGDAPGDAGAGREVGGVGRGPGRVAGRPAGPERIDADRLAQAARPVAEGLDPGRHRRGHAPRAAGAARRADRDGPADLRPGRRDGHRRALGRRHQSVWRRPRRAAREGRGHRARGAGHPGGAGHAGRAHHRPAVPADRHRPAGHRAPRPERVRRAQRDRDRHRRQGSH